MSEEVVSETQIGIPSAGVETALSPKEKKQFRDYILFFSGQQVSLLGSSVVSFALIWWISQITASELMLGIASLVSLGPFLIVAPFSGVIADRVNRKRLLFIVDSLQSVFTVVLTIFFMLYYFTNPVDPTDIPYKTLLLTVTFIILGLRGIMQSFHSPVVAAMIPTMVPAKHLSRMNGFNFLISGIIRVVGPLVGALLLSAVDITYTLWADIITMAIALIPLLIIKIPSVSDLNDGVKKKVEFRKDFVEGLRVIKQSEGLLPMMIIATLINFFFTPVGTLLPLFIGGPIPAYFGGNENNYALVVGLLNAGVIMGGLFMVFFKGFKKRVFAAIICILVMFTGMSLLITVPTTFLISQRPNVRFWILGLIMLITMLPNPIANVSFNTSVQLMIPKDKMGRVSSVLMFISMAITPIGNFLSGVIGEYVAIPIVFTTSAIIGMLLTIILYFATPARKLDQTINRILQENNIVPSIENDELEQLEDVELEKSVLSLDEKSSPSEAPGNK
ncbi:MAG: MFS transporter [Asgard group archaeon]|nr:MFS transporter [Asgard group archaeon]